MDQYHTHPLPLGQENRQKILGPELSCGDCGHSFAPSPMARSSQCPHCGNILTHPLSSSLEQQSDGSPATPAAEWRADGIQVNEILYRYQTEWQIWTKVVENFADPNFHFAYLTAITSSNSFALAQERYQKHSAAMGLIAEEAWQTEIADRMLGKIKTIADIRMVQEGSRRATPLDFLLFAPFTMRYFKVLWLVAGMVLLAILGTL